MPNAAICSDCEFFIENPSSWDSPSPRDLKDCPKCGDRMVVFENVGARKDIRPTMPYEEPLRSFVLQIKEMHFEHFRQSYLKFCRKNSERIREVFERFVKERPVADEQEYAKFVVRHTVKEIDIDWFIQSACRKYYRHIKFLNQQAISFVPYDAKKEQEIRDKKGWYIELGATGMFYYPPARIAFYDMDMDDRISNAVYSSFNKYNYSNVKPYHIAHIWQEVTRSSSLYVGLTKRERVTTIEKTYLNDGTWYFGEAEYQGRKNGAKPWETEDKILDNIENDIKSVLPERELRIDSKTKFGMYDIYVSGVKKEDEGIIEQVIEKYRKKYPKDTFTVYRFAAV
jgi:hypothetical protein